jgi:hypothetical protein
MHYASVWRRVYCSGGAIRYLCPPQLLEFDHLGRGALALSVTVDSLGCKMQLALSGRERVADQETLL